MFERTIKYALNKTTGEVLDIDKIFSNTKEAFQIRRKYIEEEHLIFCQECDQKLFISTSKNDRVHFKHSPNSQPCILKNDLLTHEEIDAINNILHAKERPRHKLLKQKIGELAGNIESVDNNSLFVDDRYIKFGNQKRKPDVFFNFKTYPIAFEIQLSPLPLKYILDRYHFYKNNNIFLIWILDDFDVHGQTQTERDLKYLYTHQNFFKLDETSQAELRLICEFKKPFLTKDENKLRTKWKKKSICLDQLHFDADKFECYLFDLNYETEKIKKQQLHREKIIKRKKEKEAQKLLYKKNIEKVDNLISFLRDLYKNDLLEYGDHFTSAARLNEDQIVLLNEQLNLNGKTDPNSNQPFIHQLILNKNHFNFLNFILLCHAIDIDINILDKNDFSVIRQLFLTNPPYRAIIVRSIFIAGYELTKDDELFFVNRIKSSKNQLEEERNYLNIQFYNKLSGRSHYIDKLPEIDKTLFTLQSLKIGKIVGFNFTNNLALCNNAIEYYSHHWGYIEQALKTYGQWNKLLASDRKKTFSNKLQKHYASNEPYDLKIYWIINILFPEITNDMDPQLKSLI